MYDLDLQFCCQSGMILNKNEPVQKPRKISVKVRKPTSGNLENDNLDNKNLDNENLGKENLGKENLDTEKSEHEILKMEDSSTRVAVNVQWEEVKAADTYEVEIGTAFNATWTQEKSQVESLGGGDTMGLSITTIENLQRGYSYKIRVKAYDCVKRVSEWSGITVKISAKGTVKYV